MATIQKAKAPTQEQRIVLHNISWQTYECLLADHESASAPRFTYDRGDLEIMSPLLEHEDRRWATERLVEAAVQEMGVEFMNAGSTTFKRQDLDRGFEPDSCFYIQNELAVRHKRSLDLRTDPPPDVVIEIDLTHSSIDKLDLFATLGIPEVWRYEGGRVAILLLSSGAYVPTDESRALPGVTASDVSKLIAAVGMTGRAAWLRRVREWAEGLLEQ